MKKLLIAAVLLVGLLAAAPAGAQTVQAPTPPSGGSGPQSGEIALGAFVAPDRAGGRHGASTSIKAGVGCSIQCITSGVAYGRGPDARLVVTTDTPATIRIIVSRAGYYRQISSSAGATSFSADFDDLEADTHYDAFVSVFDGAGHLANRSGSFRTLQRNVRVLFNEATVWTAPYGGDPFYGQTWLEGVGGIPYATGDLVAGKVHLGAQTLLRNDTDRYLAVGYELTQRDEGVDVCEAQSDPDGPEVGYGNCDYSTTAWLAEGELDLDDRPGGAADVNDYWISGTMILPGGNALPGGYGSPLDFTIPTAVRVTFT